MREVRTSVAVEAIEAPLMANISTRVMAAEYHEFFNHIHWHELNSQLTSRPPLTTYQRLLDQLQDKILSAIGKAELRIIRLPQDLGHQEYLRTLPKILEESFN